MIAYRCYMMDVCVLVSFCACNLTLTEKDVEIDKSESQCVVCHTNVKIPLRQTGRWSKEINKVRLNRIVTIITVGLQTALSQLW
jgi:hypothetical protein